MPSRTIPLDLPQTLAELDKRLTTVEKALTKLKHDAKPTAKPKPVTAEPDKPEPVAPVDSTIPVRPYVPSKGRVTEYTARPPREHGFTSPTDPYTPFKQD